MKYVFYILVLLVSILGWGLFVHEKFEVDSPVVVVDTLCVDTHLRDSLHFLNNTVDSLSDIIDIQTKLLYETSQSQVDSVYSLPLDDALVFFSDYLSSELSSR